MFVAFFLMSEKGELAHYPPYGPPSKHFVSEVVVFEHKNVNSWRGVFGGEIKKNYVCSVFC